jgi:dihydroneopterin aldolase
VKFKDDLLKLSGNFTINATGEYKVLAKHIQTINNEKKLQKNLADEIADRIIEELSDKLNDL